MDDLLELAHGIVNTEGQGHIYPVAAIRALEDEVEQRQTQWDANPVGKAPMSAYVEALLEIIGSTAEPAARSLWYVNWRDWFQVLRTTPEQRARAFIKAMGHSDA